MFLEVTVIFVLRNVLKNVWSFEPDVETRRSIQELLLSVINRGNKKFQF